MTGPVVTGVGGARGSDLSAAAGEAPATLERGDGWPGWALALLVAVGLWSAHAVVLFAHEYAHAFTAWALGWKADPFDLGYPRPSPLAYLIQLGVNQKVDEDAIFRAGRGVEGAAIAGAGMVLGNAALTYPIGRLGFGLAQRAGRPASALFCAWITAASVGNLLDYVPIRTFDGGISDMRWVERGLGWSSWTALVVLGAPTLLATADLLLCFMPRAMRALFPDSRPRRAVVSVVCVLLIFGFYGAAGLLEDGPVSQRLSRISLFVLAPAAAIVTAGSVFTRPRPLTPSLR